MAIGEDDVVVGAAGALEARKGHRFLIEAMALLRKTDIGGRLKCIIAGGGSLTDELAVEVRLGGLADIVRMPGPIGNIREFLWAIDIFALPSLKEGLGVSLLEAMACGLPAVASRVGGAAEAVIDGVTGYAVEPADSGAIASAIERLARAPEMRAAMGAAGRDRAITRYSLESMIDATIELYRKCLETRGREKKWGR
jgi:glycosyltransferase involved in cell wall biosynthesis